MTGQSRGRRIFDRVFPVIFFFGVYDLIELILEDIILWLMIRSRKKKRKALRKARINELLIRKG